MNILTALQSNPVFTNVPVEQLEWLIAEGEVVHMEEGDMLFQSGAPIQYFFVILEGRFQVYAMQAGQRRDAFVFEPGDITGALPYSRGKVSGGTAVAIEPCRVFRLPKELLRTMTREHFELTEVLVHQMTDRVRELGKMQQINEKMMSLGKLSAGLAHELNNPAAAIVRSSAALKAHLSHTPDKFKKVMSIEAVDRQVDVVNQFVFDKINAPAAKELSLMERSRQEDDVLDWLEDHAVSNAYDIASVFVDFGVHIFDLDALESELGPNHLDPILNWVCNNFVTEKIVTEIEEASKRIGHIVDSIKSYTHMDRATSKAKIHIREGLVNTLTLLNHKLKEKQIKVVKEFPDDLPEVEVFVGELNQVWTNIIDNAIDAMEAGGTLEIVCAADKRWLKTSIIDSGNGIPAGGVGFHF
jgi:signal transduction histidine kinase